MKGQNSPEVANQGWSCMNLWSPKPFTCKRFLKKWPHWGSCECTGWRTPNTVLYIEEKPRGENRLWWVSTSCPISDRKPRGVCSPARKEGAGDCKHLLQGRGMERSASIGYLWTGKLRVSLQLWCAKSSKEKTAGRPLPPRSLALHSRIRLYSTIDSSVSARCCLTM